jgi:hypothetical protein
MQVLKQKGGAADIFNPLPGGGDRKEKRMKRIKLIKEYFSLQKNGAFHRRHFSRRET